MYQPHPINPAAMDITSANNPVISWPTVEKSMGWADWLELAYSNSKSLFTVIVAPYLLSKSMIRPLDQPKPSWTSYSPPPPYPPKIVASY